MYFKYGGYQHADNEIESLTTSERRIFGQRGRVERVVRQMSLRGTLVPSSADQATINSEITALKNAYQRDGQDAIFYTDAGAATLHKLIDSQSTSGVQVKSFDFPESDGAEFATQRTYQITLEAEFLDAGADPLVSFEETLTIVGTGGPVTLHVPLVTGPPQKQVVAQRSVVRATQRGQAVGLLSYPRVPAPIFPAAEMQPLREIERSSPQMRGRQFNNYGARWSYVFESAGPLGGRPSEG